MFGWHRAELFALPLSACFEFYAWISGNCQKEFECCHVLEVSIMPAFLYFSDIQLHNDSAPAIWHVDFPKYALIYSLRFLTAARDSLLYVTCINSQMGSSRQSVPVSCILALTMR